jgi:hypothetical protein
MPGGKAPGETQIAARAAQFPFDRGKFAIGGSPWAKHYERPSWREGYGTSLMRAGLDAYGPPSPNSREPYFMVNYQTRANLVGPSVGRESPTRRPTNGHPGGGIPARPRAWMDGEQPTPQVAVPVTLIFNFGVARAARRRDPARCNDWSALRCRHRAARTRSEGNLPAALAPRRLLTTREYY